MNKPELNEHCQYLDKSVDDLKSQVKQLNTSISRLENKFENAEDRLHLKIREELAVGVLKDILRIENQISNLNNRLDLCEETKEDIKKINNEFEKLSLKLPSNIIEYFQTSRATLEVLESRIPPNNIQNLQDLKTKIGILNERIPQNFNERLLSQISAVAVTQKIFWRGIIGSLFTGVSLIILTFNTVSSTMNKRIDDTRDKYDEIQKELKVIEEEIKKIKS